MYPDYILHRIMIAVTSVTLASVHLKPHSQASVKKFDTAVPKRLNLKTMKRKYDSSVTKKACR